MTRAFQLSLAANVLLASVCSVSYFWKRASAPVEEGEARIGAGHAAAAGSERSASVSHERNLRLMENNGPSVASPALISEGERSSSLSSSAVSGPRQAAGSVAVAATPALEPASSSVGGEILASPPSASGAASAPSSAHAATGFTPMQPGAVPAQPMIGRAPTYPAVFAHNAAAAAQAAQGGPASPVAPVSTEEQAMLDKINSDFVNAIGGADQNPDDPAYQLRWQAAQEASDAQYKKFFGGRAYVRGQIESARQAAIEVQQAGSQVK